MSKLTNSKCIYIHFYKNLNFLNFPNCQIRASYQMTAVTTPFVANSEMIKRSSVLFVWKVFRQTGSYALKISQKTMMRKNRLIVGWRRSLWLLQAYLPFADTSTLQTLVYPRRTSARGSRHLSPSFIFSFSFLFQTISQWSKVNKWLPRQKSPD